jgi:hypothetical protein
MQAPEPAWLLSSEPILVTHRQPYYTAAPLTHPPQPARTHTRAPLGTRGRTTPGSPRARKGIVVAPLHTHILGTRS